MTSSGSEETLLVSLRLPRHINDEIDEAVLHRQRVTGKRTTRSAVVAEVLERGLAPMLTSKRKSKRNGNDGK